MYVSHKRQIVFIHIPKTGGSAIRELCADLQMERIGTRHNSLSELGTAKRWRKYQIITIVRHPVDRLISMYRFHHLYRKLDPEKHARRWSENSSDLDTFNSFVRNRARHSIPMVQAEFLKHPFLQVKVYRYEDSAHDQIRSDLGFDVQVRKDFGVNFLGEYDKEEWSDPEGVAFIREHCAEDFRRFHYG